MPKERQQNEQSKEKRYINGNAKLYALFAAIIYVLIEQLNSLLATETGLRTLPRELSTLK